LHCDVQAVECDEVECVELLLAAKSDIAVKDRSGNTSLHLAAQHGYHEVLELLLAALLPERKALLETLNNVS